MDQGRFRIERDRSGREMAINGAGNIRLFDGLRAEARKEGVALSPSAGEPRRQASQGTDRSSRELTALIRELARSRVMAGRHAPRSSVLIAALVAAGGLAHAGGPLAVRDDGDAVCLEHGCAIGYRTDDGPLSATVSEAAARKRASRACSMSGRT